MKAILKKKSVLLAGCFIFTASSALYLVDNSDSGKQSVKNSYDHPPNATEKTSTINKTNNADSELLFADSNNLTSASGQSDTHEEDKTESGLSIIEMQNLEVEFQNIAEINDFLQKSISLPNAALAPLIKELKNDEALMKEWLTWLVNADPDKVLPGTEIVLATFPVEELVGFASDSLAYGNASVVAITVAALAQQSDFNPNDGDISNLVVNNLKNGELSNNAKGNALKVLAQGADFYSGAERNAVINAVSEQLLESNQRLKSEAVNALLALDPKSAVIEDFILTGIQHESIDTRKRALERLDYRLELGLELTSQAVSTIHSQILNDLNGGIEFAEGEREGYLGTAAYILGNLQLSQAQVSEMKASGIPYEDLRQENSAPEPMS